MVELTKKIEILNTTKSSDNEKNDRHTGDTICHKCKQYGHTKKQCDKHNKIVKQISKLRSLESLDTFIQTVTSCRLQKEQTNQKYLCLKHKILWYLLVNW